MYNMVLIAFDGSKPSVHVLQHAIELVKTAGTKKIIILHVNDEPMQLLDPVYNVNLDQLIHRYNHKILSIANELLLAADVLYETQILEGDPSKETISFVEENPYDVIVMGREGKGLIMKTFLGSISHAVAHSVGCPVIIVK